jgi:isochorismate synthase
VSTDLFQKVNELIKDQLPFFLFRKKDASDIRLLVQKDQTVYKTAHDKMTCACFSKFLNNDNQYFIYGEDNYNFNTVDLVFEASKSENHLLKVGEDSRDRHEKLVVTAIDSIKKGDFKKVVLSRKQKIKGDFQSVAILKNLLQKYPSANCYFWYHPEIGQWCGATPEVLLTFSGKILHTMSLAGTMKMPLKGVINWGEKEREEQQIVTDSIVNDLIKVGVESLHQGAQETVAAGELLHLQTLINAEISINRVDDYLKALHPTPAVCGLPKQKALQFIIDNEGYDRSFYTGYLGILEPKKQEYYVNLRCMQVLNDGVVLYAGGGITAKSNPVAEFEETENKMNTMKKLLY